MFLRFLKFGISTGAAAAAAAKAAALYLNGPCPQYVGVPTPLGIRLEIAVERCWREGEYAAASVRKFSGDNPDVLDGVEIVAKVRRCEGEGVAIRGGRGVGVVAAEGLPVPKGEPAINPVPREIIKKALEEAGPGCWEVVIEVPRGEELAAKTMNPALGVVGGISILGTTGIEEPASAEEFERHIPAMIEAVARRCGGLVVIDPGNVSAPRLRARFGDCVVVVGDHIGEALDAASRCKAVSRVVLAGIVGKLAKVAGGVFNTHSKIADCRLELLALYTALATNDLGKAREVLSAKSAAEALERLRKYGVAAEVLSLVAEAAWRRAQERLGKPLCVGIFDREGEIAVWKGECPQTADQTA